MFRNEKKNDKGWETSNDREGQKYPKARCPREKNPLECAFAPRLKVPVNWEYLEEEKKRREYNPAQLTGRSKVGAPFPRSPGFLSRCIRFRIVSWKQKAGSLCPAFKSSQSSVSSACLLPRPLHLLLLPLYFRRFSVS